MAQALRQITGHLEHGAARITVPEICARMGLGRTVIYALLEAGIIPALRVGRRWIIGRCAYLEWEGNFGKRNTQVVQ